MRDLRGARKRIPTEARFLRPKGYAFDTTASMTRHMRPHGSKRCRTTLTLTSAGLLSFGCGSRTGLPGLADGSTEDCSSATTVVLAAGQEHPLGVAVQGTQVYWVDQGTCSDTACSGTVMTVSKCGGTPTTLASGQSPWTLAINETTVFWINFG